MVRSEAVTEFLLHGADKVKVREQVERLLLKYWESRMLF